MELSEFSYELPEELIAQTPYLKRDEARLLVIDRESGEYEDKIFKDILEYIDEGDCLVLNETKVLPARIYGKKQTGAFIEMLLLKEVEKDIWEVMVRPGNKVKLGASVYFGNLESTNFYDKPLLKAEVLEILEDGLRKVKFTYTGIFNQILDKIGVMPLPPYITEKLEEQEAYQTVYAKNLGSSAAPTAGLHFTTELLKKLKEKKVNIVKITLHVGIGTFRPVKVKNILEHKMHTEEYVVSEEAAKIINETKRNGKKVIAVGTTSCRTLETVTDENGVVYPQSGSTNIFIYPGYKFKCIDALITNFHLPESTLLMLVSAFSSKENILRAYNYAVNKKYKFFSFGDAMLLYNKKSKR